MDKPKFKMVITCRNDEDKMEIGGRIHDQLVGNPDYIDCNIILNIDSPGVVYLYIFEECKEIPKITLF